MEMQAKGLEHHQVKLEIVTGSVLINDGPGYFKDVSNGKILENDIESGEGFEEEQEIFKDLASKINIPKA